MSEHANAFDSLHMAANTQTAFRLMQVASFEFILGGELTWLQSGMAMRLFRGATPESFFGLSDMFTQISPRLSSASLQALIPGAQGRWSAEIINEKDHTRFYELIIERGVNNDDDEACFSGFIRDVTQDHQDVIQAKARRKAEAELGCVTGEDFKAQRALLTQLAREHCQDAAMMCLSLRGLDHLRAHYGIVSVDHIYKEILGRLSAFLPQVLSVTRREESITCLLANAEELDFQRLSQALTIFPITTPQGAVTVELDIDVTPLHAIASHSLPVTSIVQQKDGTPDITEDDIIDLLNQRSLSLALQPICAAATGKLHHYEALLRIDDPVKGPQSAWRHIIAAEAFGLIHLLDHRALERAALLMIRYPDIHIALNISAGTVGDTQKQDDYLQQLDALPAMHERLTIEMTETMALAQPALAAQFAERLRARGCHLSIDDFGAGHTSFKTLMSTEATQIKLDGSLIEGICQSVSQQNFVRLMVDFAATFDVSLVAERIETAEERLLLASLGVDFLQGYFLGRPISEHDFTGRAPQRAFN